MYQIYADSVCIFDDTLQGAWALAPKLTLTAGAAGSLSFTLPRGAAGYDSVQRLTSTISILRDGTTIWMGRPLSEERDLWGGRSIFCEGALAWLNDTIAMVTDPTMSVILQAHNAKELANRQIQFGGAWTAEYLAAEADGSTSLQLATRMTQELGGLLDMKYPGGVPSLYWLQNYPVPTGNEQSLVFGENLLDFTRSWDMTDFATCCYVQGAEIEDSNGGTGFHYNSGWVVSTAMADYGRIEKYFSFPDLDTDALCIDEADAYLRNQQFAEMQITVTALDLHILNPTIKSFDLLERVHVVSPLHGLDGLFAVTNLEIPLDAPENTAYTLGFVNVDYVRRVRTLTKQQKEQFDQTADEMAQNERESKERDSELDGKIDDETAARISAIEDTIRRMNAGTRGYVTIDYSATQGAEGTDGIYITDEKLSTEDGMTMAERLADAGVQNMWKWTMDGLGFSDDAGDTYKVAITMDGEILSEFIKLYGDLSVFESQTGLLGGKLGFGLGNNEISQTPGIHMYDPSQNVEVIVTSDGARMSFANYHLYIASNGVVVINGADPQLGVPVTINGDLTVTGTINGQVI